MFYYIVKQKLAHEIMVSSLLRAGWELTMGGIVLKKNIKKMHVLDQHGKTLEMNEVWALYCIKICKLNLPLMCFHAAFQEICEDQHSLSRKQHR